MTVQSSPRATAPVVERAEGVVRAGPARAAGLLAAVLALAVTITLSLVVGSRDVPLGTVWAALTGAATGTDASVVLDLRVPRTLIGLAAGLGLGVAGALIQAVTRNPLADPGILGVTFGASFAVAIAVGLLGVTAPAGYVWFALAGALVTTVVVYLIGAAGRGSVSPARMTLAGIAIGAVLSGIIAALTLTDPEGFTALRSWEAGSLADRGWEVLAPVAPLLVVGLVLATLLARSLNAVALGDDLAASLGANVGLTRVVALAAITLLAGGATAMAGPIAFVGLMIPHVARWVVGPDQRWILAYTSVLAPVLLLVADVLGRVLLRPGELQVGIVTAFLGAPVLIALVRRSKVTAL